MPNIEALQQLRRVVKNAPADLLHMRAVVEEASCGTARCAVGWCIIDPWFQKNTAINDFFPVDWADRKFGREGDDELDPSERLIGIAEIFGLEDRDTDNLFGSNLSGLDDEHAVSKKEVLWNIDELLAGRSTMPYKATDEYVPIYAGGKVNPRYVVTP